MQLFRSEAMRGQDRLHGDVALVPPVSWQLLGGFLLAAIVVAAAFLMVAEYSKVTVADGRLSGDKGIVRITPMRAGVVDAVLVEEGQRVRAGTPLARIALSTSDGEASLAARRSAAVARRAEILGGRGPEIAQASRERMNALNAEIAGARVAVDSINAQIVEQRQLVRSASEDLDKARLVAVKGFVSVRDIREREEQLATRRQALSRLEEELAARRAQIIVGEANLARAQSDLDVQMGDLESSRAELAGLAASDENAQAIIVRATEAGIITGIVVHAGDTVQADEHMMSVVPNGTRLQARIEVPPEAAGFVEAGQTIRLAVDAFPYQVYGTVDARIDSVSMATVPIIRADGSTHEVFLVNASLQTSVLPAYGRLQPLRPGMTVSARITTRARSLAEWLFDPLFAVGRR